VPVTSLAAEAFLFPRSREGHGGTYDRLMRGACAVAGFEPHVLFEINDCQSVQSFVAAGLGIAVLPRLALDPVNPAVAVRELSDAPSRRVLAARLAGAAPSAIADEAIALLRDAAAGST
jgi:DNA-binding transcriptional LysR family regulator